MTPTIQQTGVSARTAHGTPIPPDRSTLSSEPFEIIAESGGRFFIHSEILAAQSEPFRRTITGPWTETTEKKIDLRDWDSDTVGRFVEFLYFGQYRVPESDDGGEVGERGDPNRADTPDVIHSVADQEEPVAMNVGIDVLLAHAKVYALAQYKAVEGLKIMALGRLRTVLEEIDRRILRGNLMVTAQVMANITELLEYVYSHTDSLINSVEPMRTLVLRFVARNFQALMEWKEMRMFLSDRGDLAVELMTEKGVYDLEKICRAEKEVQGWKYRVDGLRMEVQRLTAVVQQYEARLYM